MIGGCNESFGIQCEMNVALTVLLRREIIRLIHNYIMLRDVDVCNHFIDTRTDALADVGPLIFVCIHHKLIC